MAVAAAATPTWLAARARMCHRHLPDAGKVHGLRPVHRHRHKPRHYTNPAHVISLKPTTTPRPVDQCTWCRLHQHACMCRQPGSCHPLAGTAQAGSRSHTDAGVLAQLFCQVPDQRGAHRPLRISLALRAAAGELASRPVRTELDPRRVNVPVPHLPANSYSQQC